MPAAQAGSPQVKVYFMHKGESLFKESMMFSNYFFFPFGEIRRGSSVGLLEIHRLL